MKPIVRLSTILLGLGAISPVTAKEFFPDFALVVQLPSYEVLLTNLGDSPIRVDGYSISSESGSLNPAGWASMDAAGPEIVAALGPGADQFFAANPNVSSLAELNPTGSATWQPGQRWSLGFPFRSDEPSFMFDAVFRFSSPDGLVLTGGTVVPPSELGLAAVMVVPEPSILAVVLPVVLIAVTRRARQKNATAIMQRAALKYGILTDAGHTGGPVRSRIGLPGAAVVLATGIAIVAQQGVVAADVRTVALSGQHPSGTPDGVSYGSFDPYYVPPYQLVRGPVINDAGRSAFRANLTGAGVDATNNQGIWSEASGSLSLVARIGDAAPGAPDGVKFGRNAALELFTPVLNNAGQTAFYGGLTDGSVGLWSEASGNLALVARDGVPAPGTPEGVNHSFAVLRDVFPDLPRLNDAGQTAFWANVTGTGINNTNDWGIWSEATGSLALVTRSGSPAHGMPEGVSYDSFVTATGFNDAGQTAYFGFVTGTGVDPSNDQGIWAERGGTPTLVARSGSSAPGTPSGVSFREFFPTVTINNAGRVAFEAFLTDDSVSDSNDEGLWSDGSGTLTLIARRGSPAAGTPSGVNFDSFLFSSWPVLNDAGQTAFRANLSGGDVTSLNNQGIWSEGSGSLALVARTGSQAPGTPSGVRFADLHLPALNEVGQTAFRANLTGTGVNSTNDRGIWATDETGSLQLIARKGLSIEVAPGDFRTLSDLDFVSASGNGDGRASGFNNLGQLVFWARFTNGTQGVVVSSAVAHLPGDFNNDGSVDAADYVVWRKADGTPAEYDAWRANFGRTLFTVSGSGTANSARASANQLSATVPEPTCILLVVMGPAVFVLGRRRRPNTFAYASIVGYRQLSLVFALTACAVMQHVLANGARSASIEFDASATSPPTIAFDPDATFEARSSYVSGRVPTNVKGPIIGGTNINTLVGADAFYTQGFTGTNAVIANIEAGHIWSGHESLTHVQQISNHSSVLNEFDRHATGVGAILGGRRGGANPGPYQEGMAPDAKLFSGAMATQWNGPRYSTFNTDSTIATFDQYRRAFNSGVNLAGRTADVINSSWYKTDPTTAHGSDSVSIGLDGFANANPRTLFVVVAGNAGPGPNTVWAPASGYNNLSVAALGRNPPYDQPASFSSGGPNNYVDPVNGTKNNVRQVVDIAAPGQNLSAAYYGGETGGNGTTDNPSVGGSGPTGLPNGSLGGSDYYTRGGLAGTSYAAPTVAGGAALLYDAAYSMFPDNADARDARVMKAVLMNSADKTVGWNNGQVDHPNGNGGVLTTQGLDNRVGAGRLNLAAAYGQHLMGTTDVVGLTSGNLGTVNGIGWDFGQVVNGTTNDYYFDSPLEGGSTLTATLTWFRDRRINDSNTVFDDSYDDLNLEVWSVVDGTLASLISESISLYNESEHFSFALPTTGEYALRVRWFTEVFDRIPDVDQEFYGLAWHTLSLGFGATSIPEPSSVIILILIAPFFTPEARTFRRKLA